MGEIQQLPLEATWRRALVRSLWFLARIVEKAFGAVYNPVSSFRFRCDGRLRLPPGVIVEQTEHPPPTPKGPWRIKHWSDGGDYLLERPDRSNFERLNRDSKYKELYVYPQHIKVVK